MKKTRKPTPKERLAILLREAYLTAYVRDNPFHDRRDWEHVKVGWLRVAEEALKLGLTPPGTSAPRTSRALRPKTPDLPGQTLFREVEEIINDEGEPAA